MGCHEQLHSGEWGGTEARNAQGDSVGTTPQLCKREPVSCLLNNVGISKILGLAEVPSKAGHPHLPEEGCGQRRSHFLLVVENMLLKE